MAVVTASGLQLAFGDQVVLDSVDLVIQDGERVGLVGRNGGGKTTLARVIAGALSPDGGISTIRAGASAAYLPQQPEFVGSPTAREVVTSGLAAWSEACSAYQRVSEQLDQGAGSQDGLIARQAELAAKVESLGGWEQNHRVERVTQHLGIDRLDDSVAEMSGGERRRVDLARVLVAQPDLAVLDEPTNHLDVDTIEWLEDFLVEDYSGALLLITHDRYVLDRVVSRTLELSQGTLYSYDGGWSSYLLSKAERAAQDARSESNRQNVLRRELDWLRRSPKARTTKSKSRIKRAEALMEAGPPDADRDISAISMQKKRSGKTAFELSSVSVHTYGKTLVDGLDLVVRDGERIGIIGPNGVGKTTLLNVLLGRIEPTAGEVRIAHNTRFAYFDQERTHLDNDRSVMENICDNMAEVEIGGRSMSAHAYLSRFLFDGDKQRQLVASLSGGERARVQLAKFLLEPANVLLLDEPTNDLDVATLAALEDFLVNSGVTTLFVTHDRYFLDRAADAVLCYEGAGKVVRYEGSYQGIRAARAAAAAVATAPKQVTEKRRPKPKRVAKAGLTFTEKHELGGLMPLIEEAEANVARLEDVLADPELYASRGSEVRALREEADAARVVLDKRVERWEELELKRETGD